MVTGHHEDAVTLGAQMGRVIKSPTYQMHTPVRVLWTGSGMHRLPEWSHAAVVHAAGRPPFTR